MDRFSTALAAAMLMALIPAEGLAQGKPPENESALVVYGDDPCPRGDAEEIVVCARRPETERYRIPKELRGRKKERGSVAWAVRFADLEEATRFTRPNSCSVVGTWGQTGCLEAAVRQWYAERRARNDEPE